MLSQINRKALCGILALLTVAAPVSSFAQQEKEPSANKEEKLPEAKTIIDRFVKEIGGKEAFSKIQSQRVKGRFEMAAQGIKGDLEVLAKRPNLFTLKVNMPGVGDIVSGYNGKVGWAINPMTGPMLLEGKPLEQLKEQADFDAVLHDPSDYKTMETVEKTQFAGAECYKLKLVRASGQESMEFFDAKTGLLMGSVASAESPFGTITVTNTVSDYKKFEDILFATKMTQKMGPVEQVMTFNTFEFNKVEDSTFELPKEIKELTSK